MSGMSPDRERARRTRGCQRPPRQQPEREFTIKARTQGQMVRRRFIRHRGAIIGFSALVFVIVHRLHVDRVLDRFPDGGTSDYSSTKPDRQRGTSHPRPHPVVRRRRPGDRPAPLRSGPDRS